MSSSNCAQNMTSRTSHFCFEVKTILNSNRLRRLKAGYDGMSFDSYYLPGARRVLNVFSLFDSEESLLKTTRFREHVLRVRKQR
jgi:hypothetical protein